MALIDTAGIKKGRYCFMDGSDEESLSPDSVGFAGVFGGFLVVFGVVSVVTCLVMTHGVCLGGFRMNYSSPFGRF